MSTPDILIRPSITDVHPLAADRKLPWRRPGRLSRHPLYSLPEHHEHAANLPPAVDLTPEMPRVYDQLSVGSCTSQTLAGLFQFLQIKQGLPSWVPSRLFIYWGERYAEGTVREDAGANLDDGISFMQVKGVPPESLWAYDVRRFARTPPTSAWTVAVHHKLGEAVAIPDGDLIGVRSRLASGYPVTLGFTAFPGLQSDAAAKTGIIPLPTPGEEPIGGHAVLLTGYDDSARMFKIRNSWSSAWGDHGYGYLDYSYVGDAKLAGEFRSATHVS